VDHQRDGGGHVAADAVTRDGQLAAIETDLLAVLGHPHRGLVGLVDLDRKLRVRHRCVLDEHGRSLGPHDEVTHQPLVVLEVAGYPHGTVVEHERRERSGDALGADDIQRDLAPVDGDLALVDIDAGEVHGRLVLQGRDDVPRLVAGQLPEWAAVLVELLEEGAGATVDGGVLRRIDLGAFDCDGHDVALLFGVGDGDRRSVRARAIARPGTTPREARTPAVTQRTRPSATSDARPSGSVQLPTSRVASGNPLVRVST
jgi:hypothetical protein